MSDGPHRSLNMNRSWKRVAEYADNGAYPLTEVGEAFLPALEQSCREEVPEEVWRELKRIFGNTQPRLFGDQSVQDIEALRSKIAGPLGCSLVELAIRAASKGSNDLDDLVKVTTMALLQRAARGIKQVEEHWYRKSNGKRTENVRQRLENALNKAALETLARQRLDLSAVPKAPRPSKKRELDDGVQL